MMDQTAHRAAAITAHNLTWELLERTPSDDESPADWAPHEIDELLARAYASSYHWARAAERGPANAARASWLLSRVHAVLGDGHGPLALHHADRCGVTVTEAGLADFDLAYAHEARGRALASLGRLDEARVEVDLARSVPIADDEDRALVDADLAAPPWFGLKP